jgi:hypothetical protein
MSYGTGYTLLNTGSNSYNKAFNNQVVSQLTTQSSIYGGNNAVLYGQTFLSPGVWFVNCAGKAIGSTSFFGGGGAGSGTMFITYNYFGTTASNIGELVSGLSAVTGVTGALTITNRNIQNTFDLYTNGSSIYRTSNSGNTVFFYVSNSRQPLAGSTIGGTGFIGELKCVRLG